MRRCSLQSLNGRGTEEVPQPCYMLMGSGLITDGSPDGVLTIELSVREERGAAGVDRLDNGRVVCFPVCYPAGM